MSTDTASELATPPSVEPKKKHRNPVLRVLRIVFSILFTVIALFIVWPQQWGGPVTWAIVAGTSMEPKYHTGDVAVAIKSYSGYNVGDIVVYQVHDGPATGRVVHRLVRKLDDGNFLTKGDNKEFTDRWEVQPSWIQGKVDFMIPQGARYLLILRSPIFLAVIAGLMVAAMFWPKRDPEDAKYDEDADGDPDSDPESEPEKGAIADPGEDAPVEPTDVPAPRSVEQ